MLAIAVLLAAASAVSGTSLRVTSCGGGGLECDGTYAPIPGGGLNSKPVYARQGNPEEPGFFFTGSMGTLLFLLGTRVAIHPGLHLLHPLNRLLLPLEQKVHINWRVHCGCVSSVQIWQLAPPCIPKESF